MLNLENGNGYRAVIFDCDGVLFDSRNANIQYYNHIRARFGLPPMNEAQVEYVHSATSLESLAHIFKDTPYLEQALAFRHEVDYTPFIDFMVMEPDLMELVQALEPRFYLAIATNRSNTIGPVLDHFGLTPYFHKVVSSLDVRFPKPHPESLVQILEAFSLPPSAALYVGDSGVDQQAAEAAGVPFAAYRNPNLSARFHIERLQQILAITRP